MSYRLIKNLLFILSLVFSLLIISKPAPVKAYSPLIAVCSNNLAAWWPLTDNVKQLFEVRDDHLMLDAAAAHVMTFNHQSDQVTAQVIKRDGPVLATAVGTATTSPTWIYFDFTDVSMPRGVYYLQVSSSTTDGAAVHYTNDPNCIGDSYMMVNDSFNTDHDMGFGIYAYTESTNNDNSTNNSNNNQPANNTTNDQTTGQNNTTNNSTTDNSTTSNSNTPSSSTLKSSWTPPTKEEILKMTKDSQNSNSWIDSFLSLSPLIMILLPLLFLIGLIILIVWLVKRANKKSPIEQNNQKDQKPSPKK